MVSFWRYKNEPKYVLSSNVPILHTSILQFGCCWTLTDGVWVPLINQSAPSVEVGWHVIPTKQPAHWSSLTWWFRLREPSQNARNIQVWNSYWLFQNHQVLHEKNILDLQETTIEWSGATPVPLRLDESTGFRFRHVGRPWEGWSYEKVWPTVVVAARKLNRLFSILGHHLFSIFAVGSKVGSWCWIGKPQQCWDITSDIVQIMFPNF